MMNRAKDEDMKAKGQLIFPKSLSLQSFNFFQQQKSQVFYTLPTQQLTHKSATKLYSIFFSSNQKTLASSLLESTTFY